VVQQPPIIINSHKYIDTMTTNQTTNFTTTATTTTTMMMTTTTTPVYLPGEELPVQEGFLRGHGTVYSTKTGGLTASVVGRVERVNKLITVKPLKARYTGSVGDVVVGRITEVGNKRWKLDINARVEATLLLGAINLPGGAQRRRTYEDVLQMRELFAENDVVSCEVSSFYRDGGMAVQTRSLKYGKLENGLLCIVPPSLIKRLKTHFVTLNCGVHLVIGHNGYIWLTVKTMIRKTNNNVTTSDTMDSSIMMDLVMQQDDENDHEMTKRVVEMETSRAEHAKRTIHSEERFRIARVANILRILADRNMTISPQDIDYFYRISLTSPSLVNVKPYQLLIPSITDKLFEEIQRDMDRNDNVDDDNDDDDM
jgi:exosome complex RNA-binding protein Rrp4